MSSEKERQSVERSVAQKVIAGQCLVCGKQGEMRRGLCNAHYLRFVRTKAATPRRERAAFEESIVKQGLVLPPGKARLIRNPNPFRSAP